MVIPSTRCKMIVDIQHHRDGWLSTPGPHPVRQAVHRTAGVLLQRSPQCPPQASRLPNAVHFLCGSSVGPSRLCFCLTTSSSQRLNPKLTMLVSSGTHFFTVAFPVLKQRSRAFSLPSKTIYRYSSFLPGALSWACVF